MFLIRAGLLIAGLIATFILIINTAVYKRNKLTFAPWIFLLTGLIFFMIYVIIPIFRSINLSFYKWNGLRAPDGTSRAEFIGLQNYARLLDDRNQPKGRQQMVLDIALPEVADYIYQSIFDILSTYDIDYIKWDHNRVLPFSDAEQTYALYALLARLNKAFPDVEIESCASGGGAPLLKQENMIVSGSYLMSHGINLPWSFPMNMWVIEGRKLDN